MPARSVCLVTLSLSEAGPGRFGGQVSVTDIVSNIYHTIPYHTIPYSIVAACNFTELHDDDHHHTNQRAMFSMPHPRNPHTAERVLYRAMLCPNGKMYIMPVTTKAPDGTPLRLPWFSGLHVPYTNSTHAPMLHSNCSPLMFTSRMAM